MTSTRRSLYGRSELMGRLGSLRICALSSTRIHEHGRFLYGGWPNQMKAGRPLATTSIAHPTDISLPVGKLSWDQSHDENRRARNNFMNTHGSIGIWFSFRSYFATPDDAHEPRRLLLRPRKKNIATMPVYSLTTLPFSDTYMPSKNCNFRNRLA